MNSHTPLTRTQIAELFHACRLGRTHAGKHVEKKEWRTIDALFPLLKYDSSAPRIYETGGLSAWPPRTRVLMVLLLVGGVAALALLGYIFTNGAGGDIKGPGSQPVDRARRVENVSPSHASQGPIASVDIARSSSNLPLSQQHSTGTMFVPPNSAHTGAQTLDSRQARLTQERLNAEQRQREQTQTAKLAQDRLNAERKELEQQKAAGRTEIIPLDQFTVVHNVGGSDIRLKVHDDLTSVDVWVDSSRPVRFTKQKGISGSGTDETCIYRNGNARLYYVWEISGTLNHCLLRVRDD